MIFPTEPNNASLKLVQYIIVADKRQRISESAAALPNPLSSTGIFLSIKTPPHSVKYVYLVEIMTIKFTREKRRLRA